MRRRLALPWLVVSMLAFAACAPKAEDIERWKGTQKGPGKLKDAVASTSLSDELRGQAVAALFEIGDSQQAMAALEKHDKVKQAAAVTFALPPLEKLLAADGNKAVLAKDALFSLRDMATPADRGKIDAQLVAWLTKDLAGRMNQGGHSGEKILIAAGPVAAAALAPLAVPGGPQLAVTSALLGKIPDPATRAAVVDKLVAAAQKSGGEIPQPLLAAIGFIGTPRAGEFLVEVAESPRKESRGLALVALIGSPPDSRTDKVLAGLGRIASDKAAPGKAREAAFNVAEKFGPVALPTLVKLIDQSEELLRWRAVEAAFVAGGEAATEPVLRALPAAAKYKLEDIDSYVVHDIRKLGDKARPAIAKLLADGSASAVTRIAALHGLGAIGKAADAATCKPLVGETAPQKNFTPVTSVGKEAEATIAALQKK